MNRRSFLRRAAAAIVGLTLARELPGIASAPVPLKLVDEELSESIRFVKTFDEHGDVVCRFDVVYGYRTLRPEFAVLVIA